MTALSRRSLLASLLVLPAARADDWVPLFDGR